MAKKRKTPAKRKSPAKRKNAGRSTTAGRRKTAGKRKSAAKRKSGRRKTAAKRTLIAPRGDKRYVRRGRRGQFKESDDVSRSLSSDRRRPAKRKAPKGQGDRGD